MDRDKVLEVLNRILEMELAGVVRYTHDSFLVFGFSRMPVVSWLRAQAQEGLLHAQEAGERITELGAYPSLAIGPLHDTQRLEIGDILREALEHERNTLALYRELNDLATGQSLVLEEYARQHLFQEEMHVGEIEKMLRRPGDLALPGR